MQPLHLLPNSLALLVVNNYATLDLYICYYYFILPPLSPHPRQTPIPGLSGMDTLNRREDMGKCGYPTPHIHMVGKCHNTVVFKSIDTIISGGGAYTNKHTHTHTHTQTYIHSHLTHLNYTSVISSITLSMHLHLCQLDIAPFILPIHRHCIR